MLEIAYKKPFVERGEGRKVKWGDGRGGAERGRGEEKCGEDGGHHFYGAVDSFVDGHVDDPVDRS